jgi:signal transduction histidine kinase
MNHRAGSGVDLLDPAETEHRAGSLARVSIEQKVPLLFGGVLLAVILTLSVSTAVEMRRTALRTASLRSASLTQQLADLLTQSSALLRAQVTTTAATSEIRMFAASGDTSRRAAALATLARAGPQPEQIAALELRDGRGAVVLRFPNAPGATNPTAADERLPLAYNDSVSIGTFRRMGAIHVYPITAPVPGVPGYHVVQWRKIAGTRSNREQLNRLIGSDAALYVANLDGSYVTDLERDVTTIKLTPQTIAAPHVEARNTTSAGDGRYLVSWAAVPHTPWAVGVEFPMNAILAPVNDFIRRMALLSVAALAIGLFAAWRMSRHITDPLRQLATAAEAMSAGDYSRTVTIDRSDELGQLGQSFNAMAAEVQQARHGLEQMVEERTRALNDTLNQLHDAQASLVRREKLAMLGQLAGGVGHELRNPLGVMTNAVYYLKAVLTTAPSNVVEYLDILSQQITLSEKIVSDLLDFARLKPPLRTPASLPELAREQIERLGPTNGVVISVDFPPDLPQVLVDRVQIGQIVQNLLTNAIQAMDHSGQITIRAHAERSLMHVDVRDTGPGVAPQDSEKIFEPLFTTKARGIGLGLAVSRTLARANQGDLTLRVTVGAGADFRLTLPVAPANREAL